MIYAWGIIRWLSENSYFYSFGFNMAYKAAKAVVAAAAQKEVEAEYGVQTTEVFTYEGDLMAALLTRLGNVCRERGIRLVIAGIPLVSTEAIISSISGDVCPAFEPAGTVL